MTWTARDVNQLLAACRKHLPALALGAQQREHQLGLVRGLSILGRELPQAARAALELAHWTWAQLPLDAEALTVLLETFEATPGADPTLLRTPLGLARVLAAAPPTDAPAEAEWIETVQSGDPERALKVARARAAAPEGLAWTAMAWGEILLFGSHDLARAALAAVPAQGPLAPVRQRMAAEAAFHLLPAEASAPALDGLDRAVWGPWADHLRAEHALRTGDADTGARRLVAAFAALPWHTNLALKLSTLCDPPPLAAETDLADTAVLLYSWNKADLLAQTLDSLAESAIGPAHVAVLDNGSTDETPEVIRRAAERFGDRFESVRLPVNVGAPAARNWLLSLDSVRNRAWAAFLDDDVILPRDWLRRLAGGLRARPDAGVVGCRITSASSPFGLQSADYNLFCLRREQRADPEGLPPGIPLFDNCAGGLDTGLFTYARPCLSVSGCCHMVRMEAIERAGNFDIRFSPSQFDDLERDLRGFAAGWPAYYAGTLAVRHVQHSSLAKAKTTAQTGHVMGNKMKLDTKYPPDRTNQLAEQGLGLLWPDLAARTRGLMDRFGLE